MPPPPDGIVARARALIGTRFRPQGRSAAEGLDCVGLVALAVLSPGQPPRLAFASTGRPAGLMPFNPVEQETMPLEPGQTFVLFSDGVSEAMNPAEDFYGEERLLEALGGANGAPSRDVVSRLLTDVRAFAAGAKQSDDITLVAVQYAPRRV